MINPLASLHAMSCEFELAERYLAEADETLLALGHLDSIVSHHKALVRLLAGQPEIAEPPLRAGVRELASIDDSATYATTAAMLAQAVYAQGRVEEAGELCVLAAGAAPADDIVTQVIWRGVRAKVLARGGEHERAQALAREAVALVEPTDLLSHRGDAMLDLAEVLLSGGRGDESREAARLALELYESKGNIAASTRGRALLHGGSEGV
jgi:tetratricopeptide (TPR) repeat protein